MPTVYTKLFTIANGATDDMSTMFFRCHASILTALYGLLSI